MPKRGKQRIRTYQGLMILLGLIFLSGCTVTVKRNLNMAESSSADFSNFQDKAPHPERDSTFSARAKTVDSLFSLKPPTPSFVVEVWTDKQIYQIGEQVTFFFRSDRGAYLTLLDVGTSGNLRILFPNPFQKDNFIVADRVYAIPSKSAAFSITADGPPGLERIKVIATTFPLPLTNFLPSEGFLIVSKKNPASEQMLRRSIEILVTEAWAESYAEIHIIKAGASFPPQGRPRTVKPKKPEKPIDITGTAGLKPPKTKKPEKPIDIIGVAGMKPFEKIPGEKEEILLDSDR